MTRKDYILLASELAEGRPRRGASEDYSEGYWSAVDHVAQALADDNSRFDRDRFIEAIRRGGP